MPSAWRSTVGPVRIGEMSARSGATRRALRHYEELGLLPARRRANGYCEYDEVDLVLVAEIPPRGAGLRPGGARPFLECLRRGSPAGAAAPAAQEVQRRKLAEVDA